MLVESALTYPHMTYQGQQMGKLGTVTDYFLGTQITVDSHCSHEIKSWSLLSWREAMTNLDSVLKGRDITLPTKVRIVKAMIFPVVMYRCESWTIKKAKCWRTDAFKLWCRRRLLRVPWTARRSNQSILKEISPEYSLEGLMLKLKLQYFGHMMWRADSLEKTLMLRKTEDRRRRGWQRMRWLDDIIDSIDMSLSKLQQTGKDREDWGAIVHESQRVGHDWGTEQQHIVLYLAFSPYQYKAVYFMYKNISTWREFLLLLQLHNGLWWEHNASCLVSS